MKYLLPFLLFLLAGCSSSKIISSWTAPEAGTYSYKKILVASIAPAHDSSTRREMEMQVVEALKTIGCTAVSFLQTFDERAFKSIRYDSARARFQREGIDGIITINLAAKEKESLYVPNKPVPYIDRNKSTPFGMYDLTNTEGLNNRGYYVHSIQLFWESSFLDLSSLALLYHAQLTSFDPQPAQKLASQYSKQIVDDLQKQCVLVAKRHK